MKPVLADVAPDVRLQLAVQALKLLSMNGRASIARCAWDCMKQNYMHQINCVTEAVVKLPCHLGGNFKTSR